MLPRTAGEDFKGIRWPQEDQLPELTGRLIDHNPRAKCSKDDLASPLNVCVGCCQKVLGSAVNEQRGKNRRRACPMGEIRVGDLVGSRKEICYGEKAHMTLIFDQALACRIDDRFVCCGNVPGRV